MESIGDFFEYAGYRYGNIPTKTLERQAMGFTMYENARYIKTWHWQGKRTNRLHAVAGKTPLSGAGIGGQKSLYPGGSGEPEWYVKGAINSMNFLLGDDVIDTRLVYLMYSNFKLTHAPIAFTSFLIHYDLQKLISTLFYCRHHLIPPSHNLAGLISPSDPLEPIWPKVKSLRGVLWLHRLKRWGIFCFLEKKCTKRTCLNTKSPIRC